MTTRIAVIARCDYCDNYAVQRIDSTDFCNEHLRYQLMALEVTQFGGQIGCLVNEEPRKWQSWYEYDRSMGWSTD